jgi:predicted nucleic acid-binding protein
MTSTLVDSNVLLDVLHRQGEWYPWSRSKLRDAADTGDVVINQIIVAETATGFEQTEDFEEVTSLVRPTRESLPWEAAYVAGRAHREYRHRGGRRDRTLPDFIIGAHALTKQYRLLTRDPRRYRRYFPDLEIIAPDTHP